MHRIGRTGRAGCVNFWKGWMCIFLYSRQTGKALSFITREDWRYARELCKILQDASQVL